MKNIAVGATVLVMAFCVAGCAKKARVYTEVPKHNPGIFLPKSASARDDFIRGVDVSTVIAQEESGVRAPPSPAGRSSP